MVTEGLGDSPRSKRLHVSVHILWPGRPEGTDFPCIGWVSRESECCFTDEVLSSQQKRGSWPLLQLHSAARPGPFGSLVLGELWAALGA